MKINNYIEFKKERDLGAIITDTFKFIRENWKEYFLTVLKIVGPVLLLTLVVLVFYMLTMSDIFSDKTGIEANPFGFYNYVCVYFVIHITFYGIIIFYKIIY